MTLKFIVVVALSIMAWMWWRRSPIRAAIREPVRPTTREEREAYAVLGLDDEADPAAVRAAHKRLIASVHPDRGGSQSDARRINAARDTLLKHRRD